MEGIGNNNASPVGYYIPIAQSDVANGVRIAVRTRGEPAAVTSLVRSAVTSLDADLAIYEISTMRTRHRSADCVLHGLRHVLHGVRVLRAVPRGRRTLRRDVVRGDAADAGDGRALGARRAGDGTDRAGDAEERDAARRSASSSDWGLALLASGPLQAVLYHVNPRDVAVFGRRRRRRWQRRASSRASCRRGASRGSIRSWRWRRSASEPRRSRRDTKFTSYLFLSKGHARRSGFAFLLAWPSWFKAPA